MNHQRWLLTDISREMMTYLFQEAKPPPDERKMRLLVAACCRLVWDRYEKKCVVCGGDKRYFVTAATSGSLSEWNVCHVCHGSGNYRWLRRHVELAEDFADGRAEVVQLAKAHVQGQACWTTHPEANMIAMARYVTLPNATHAAARVARDGLIDGPPDGAVANAIREIIGDPFSPPANPVLPTRYCRQCGAPMTMTANHLHQLGLWHCVRHRKHNTEAVTVEEMRLHKERSKCVWLTPTTIGLARSIYDSRTFERMPFLADALEEAGCADNALLEHCRGVAPLPGLIYLREPTHFRGCWALDSILNNC